MDGFHIKLYIYIRYISIFYSLREFNTNNGQCWWAPWHQLFFAIRTSLVTILNHYGPRSEDAWLASLLMQALKDLLPGMFGAELGFLVILGGTGGTGRRHCLFGGCGCGMDGMAWCGLGLMSA